MDGRREPLGVPNAQVRALADLVARRRQIIDMITAESARPRATAPEKSRTPWLQHELREIDGVRQRQLVGPMEVLDRQQQGAPSAELLD